MISLLALALAAAAPAPSTPLPQARAARPLVVPNGWYQVDVGAGYTGVAPDEPLFRLDFGGTLGLAGGLFVRVDLVRWNFARVAGYGLEQPRVAVGYGLLRGGAFELAIEAGAEVPSGGDFGGDASLLARVHGGRWVRLDVASSVRGTSAITRPASEVEGRARLVLNPIPALSFAAQADLRLVTLTGAEGLLGRVTVEVAFAAPREDGSAAWELVAWLRSPDRTFAGDAPDAPRFGWDGALGLALKMFFDRPATLRTDRWDDPF